MRLMELLIRSNGPGNKPTTTEEVKALATLLVELLTGVPSDATNIGVGAERLATAPASLHWVLGRALHPADNGPRYDTGQLTERLRHIAAGQCLRDRLTDGKFTLEEAVRHAIRLCNDLEND